LLVAGAYVFLFFLVAWPVVDLLTNVVPLRPGDLQWRYGVVGLAAGFLQTPALGIVLGLFLALLLQHRRVVRFVAIVAGIGAIGLLGAMALFALDVLQLRTVTPAERLSSFQAGALIAELKHFTTFIALALVSVGGWRSVRKSGDDRETGGTDAGVVIKPRSSRNSGPDTRASQPARE